jgi:hypothetical protein
MALFYDKNEQERQDLNVKLKRPTGFKKATMASMGYNADGSMNWHGQAMGAFMPETAIIARQVAKQASKDTDSEAVLKETDDEFMAQKMSQYQFSGEIFKSIYGKGGGGGGEQGGGGTEAPVGGENTQEAISAGAPSGGGMPSQTGIPTTAEAGLSMGGGTNALGDYGTVATGGITPPASIDDPNAPKMNPYSGRPIENQDFNSLIQKSREDKVTEDTKKRLEEDKKEKNKKAKENYDLNKMTSSASGIIGSGAKVYQTSKAYLSAEDEEIKKSKRKSVLANYNAL